MEYIAKERMSLYDIGIPSHCEKFHSTLAKEAYGTAVGTQSPMHLFGRWWNIIFGTVLLKPILAHNFFGSQWKTIAR